MRKLIKLLQKSNQTRFTFNAKHELRRLSNISNTPKSIKEPETKIINPLNSEDFFEVKQLVKLEELFKARCHYGHHAGLRCPWMSEYLFGTRKDTDIIDLDKTVPLFQQALNFVAHIACRGGHIPLVEKMAKECGEYAHCRAWRSGTFTDSMRRFGTVVRLPDLVVLLHTQEKLNETHGAVAESSKMLIPTVAVCDTDSDPSQITYPVPGNDDTISAVRLYCRLFHQAVMAAKNKRAELEKQGFTIDYEYEAPK